MRKFCSSWFHCFIAFLLLSKKSNKMFLLWWWFFVCLAWVSFFFFLLLIFKTLESHIHEDILLERSHFLTEKCCVYWKLVQGLGFIKRLYRQQGHKELHGCQKLLYLESDVAKLQCQIIIKVVTRLSWNKTFMNKGYPTYL